MKKVEAMNLSHVENPLIHTGILHSKNQYFCLSDCVRHIIKAVTNTILFKNNFNLFEIQIYKETHWKLFCLLHHSPNGCCKQSWADLKLEVRSFFLVSRSVHRPRILGQSPLLPQQKSGLALGQCI